MGFEGVFHAVKDYLQPLLHTVAIGLLLGWGLRAGYNEAQQTALLVGPVYLVLFLLAGFASRRAHRVVRRLGSEDQAARRIWALNVLIYVVLLLGAYLEVHFVVIGLFILLHVLQNIWRPILVSRFDAHGKEAQGATLLSIESQSRRVATMVFAPLVGLAVDSVQAAGPGGMFWPIGALGLMVSLIMLVLPGRTGRS